MEPTELPQRISLVELALNAQGLTKPLPVTMHLVVVVAVEARVDSPSTDLVAVQPPNVVGSSVQVVEAALAEARLLPLEPPLALKPLPAFSAHVPTDA